MTTCVTYKATVGAAKAATREFLQACGAGMSEQEFYARYRELLAAEDAAIKLFHERRDAAREERKQ